MQVYQFGTNISDSSNDNKNNDKKRVKSIDIASVSSILPLDSRFGRQVLFVPPPRSQLLRNKLANLLLRIVSVQVVRSDLADPKSNQDVAYISLKPILKSGVVG